MLDAYVAGRLDEADDAALARHLDQCAACAQAVVEAMSDQPDPRAGQKTLPPVTFDEALALARQVLSDDEELHLPAAAGSLHRQTITGLEAEPVTAVRRRIARLADSLHEANLAPETFERQLASLQEELEVVVDAIRTVAERGQEPVQVQVGAVGAVGAPVLEAGTGRRPPAGPPAPGSRLFPERVAPKVTDADRYEHIEEIAIGGSGEIWLATDRLLDRQVALKILRDDFAASKRARQRFDYESRIMARLAHPGVLPLHDRGTMADGRPYFAMRLVAQRNLAEVLRGVQNADEAMCAAYPLPRLLQIFSRMCETMGYAHARGIIHRDLKPSNILLGEFGEVYVADWGLAKQVDGEVPELDAEIDSTTHGTVLGTLVYMSPEQLGGEVEILTRKTDIYSLGVILYEILTGRRPYEGKSPVKLLMEMVRKPVEDPREVAPDVPGEVAELCARCIEREPEVRPAAREIKDALDLWLDGVEQDRRRLAAARARLSVATTLGEAYEKRRAQLVERRLTLDGEVARLGPATPDDVREGVWSRQQALVEEELALQQSFAETVKAANQSLGHRETPEAHALLASLFRQRSEEAAAAGNASDALYARALVHEHDDGTHATWLANKGTVVSACAGSVRLERQVPLGPLLVGQGIDGGEAVPAGSYLLVADEAGRMPLRVPFNVVAGETVTVADRAPEAFAGAEEFVFVAGGPARLGGDPGAPWSLPGQTVEVDPFCIGRYPVTLAEYVEFLNDLNDHEIAAGHAPRSPQGRVFLDVRDGMFSVPGVDADGDAWDERWPAHMLNWHDANAYCAWRSARDDVTYRLPTEFEWEKAARGVDGRIYPWGDGFDPTLCRMAASIEGWPMPVPVGTYARDRSPYGACDMAGLVIEWTSTPWQGRADKYVLRGAGTNSTQDWCRAAARRSSRPGWNALQFGFRLVREL